MTNFGKTWTRVADTGGIKGCRSPFDVALVAKPETLMYMLTFQPVYNDFLVLAHVDGELNKPFFRFGFISGPGFGPWNLDHVCPRAGGCRCVIRPQTQKKRETCGLIFQDADTDLSVQ